MFGLNKIDSDLHALSFHEEIEMIEPKSKSVLGGSTLALAGVCTDGVLRCWGSCHGRLLESVNGGRKEAIVESSWGASFFHWCECGLCVFGSRLFVKQNWTFQKGWA